MHSNSHHRCRCLYPHRVSADGSEARIRNLAREIPQKGLPSGSEVCVGVRAAHRASHSRRQQSPTRKNPWSITVRPLHLSEPMPPPRSSSECPTHPLAPALSAPARCSAAASRRRRVGKTVGEAATRLQLGCDLVVPCKVGRLLVECRSGAGLTR
eukprot:363990-Chlamydomonas_euryale.AAC.3